MIRFINCFEYSMSMRLARIFTCHFVKAASYRFYINVSYTLYFSKKLFAGRIIRRSFFDFAGFSRSTMKPRYYGPPTTHNPGRKYN